jgi:hypothetical protein
MLHTTELTLPPAAFTTSGVALDRRAEDIGSDKETAIAAIF